MVGAVVLALLVAGLLGYRYLTAPQRLRALAQRWLETFCGGQVQVERVVFEPARGLHLIGVQVATPGTTPFYPVDQSFKGRTVFRSDSLFLRLELWDLLHGSLTVPEILAIGPEVVLARRADDGRWNWQTLFTRQVEGSKGGPPRLPVVRLRNARLIQERVHVDGRRERTAQYVWIEAKPAAPASETYRVDLTRIYQDTADHMSQQRCQLEVDLKTLAVTGSLPRMSLDEILFMASEEVIRWVNVLDLGGDVTAESFTYGPDSDTSAVLRLSGARASIPIDHEEEQLPAEQRYLTFNELQGRITIDPGRAEVDLAGTFRGHPLTVQGILTMADWSQRQFEGLGMAIDVALQDVDLPRGDVEADPAERRLVRNVMTVRRYIDDFDGRGQIDMVCHLNKQAGPHEEVRIHDATITLRGCSGRYAKFPYRLSDLSGELYLRPDGRIELHDVTGHRGEATVVLNGLLGGRISKEGDLHILGTSLPLDEHLLRCLRPRDRALVERFRATAVGDVVLDLKRPPSPVDEPAPPWKSVIDMTIRDGTVNYVGFPYPFERVHGKLLIAHGLLTVTDFCGHRGDMRACLNGTASEEKDKGFDINLGLTAERVPLDETLGHALTEPGAGMYASLTPTGMARIEGRLFSTSPGAPLSCDLKAKVTDASLKVPQRAARVTDATMEVGIVTERVSIESMQGRLGESLITVQGQVPLKPTAGGLTLAMQSERMVLDDQVRGLLSEQGRTSWDTLKPNGPARIAVTYEQRSAVASEPTAEAIETRPASRPATGTDHRDVTYRIVLDPLDCGLCYEKFPLPLEKVKGRIVLTPEQVTIEELTARHGESHISLTGEVRKEGAASSIMLSGKVRDATFSEAWRKAVPWRLRKMWNNVQPHGNLDLDLDRLEVRTGPDGQRTWTLAGSTELNQVALDIGVPLTEIVGQLDATVSIGPDWSIDGELDWDKVTVDGRPATGVTATLAKTADSPSFVVSDLMAGFCGGQTIGRIELNEGDPRGTSYGVSLTVRDLSVESFLNAKRAPQEPPVRMHGTAEGRLTLAGRFGDAQSQHGGGSVIIRRAQMMKTPFMFSLREVLEHDTDDPSMYQDARLGFVIGADELVFQEIDLRGTTFSMVGAGRVRVATQALDLALLVGSPLRLPRIEVLTDVMEGVARELVEVHVEGTLRSPTFRAEIVGSLNRSLEGILNARQTRRR